MDRSSALESTVVQVALAGGVALVAAGALLSAGAGSPAFCVTGLLTWAWFCAQLWRLRALNVAIAGDATSRPRSTLGAATSVTVVRAWLIAIVAGHLLLPAVHGSASLNVGLLYTAAALLDAVDGRVARHGGIATQLGARLDVMTDALGLLVAPVVAVRAGRLPPWYLLLAFAYPLFRTALALQRRRGRPIFPERLTPNPRARFFAGIQMTVVAASFYPFLPNTLIWPAATFAMLPTLHLFTQEWRTLNTPPPPNAPGKTAV
jgi:CDP-diacylglycerol--glycerol-3-phosphate 3-phosphatidyltransferase